MKSLKYVLALFVGLLTLLVQSFPIPEIESFSSKDLSSSAEERGESAFDKLPSPDATDPVDNCTAQLTLLTSEHAYIKCGEEANGHLLQANLSTIANKNEEIVFSFERILAVIGILFCFLIVCWGLVADIVKCANGHKRSLNLSLRHEMENFIKVENGSGSEISKDQKDDSKCKNAVSQNDKKPPKESKKTKFSEAGKVENIIFEDFEKDCYENHSLSLSTEGDTLGEYEDGIPKLIRITVIHDPETEDGPVERGVIMPPRVFSI